MTKKRKNLKDAPGPGEEPTPAYWEGYAEDLEEEIKELKADLKEAHNRLIMERAINANLTEKIVQLETQLSPPPQTADRSKRKIGR